MRALFAGTGVELEFARGHNPWRFHSAEHYVAFMETHYGPTVKARERLTAEGRWDECRARDRSPWPSAATRRPTAAC